MFPGIEQWTLINNPFTFERLANSVKWMSVARGRQGNVLVYPYDRDIPIVRTTTIYHHPAQIFSQIHIDLSNQLQMCMLTNLNLRWESIAFNNALIEIYTSDYYRMGFHSDQALDLEENSWI